MPFESMLVMAALLLIMSGGAKLVDSAPTSGALRAARLPWRAPVVVGLALTEIAAGSAALVVGGPATAGVAMLYAGFAVFVVHALRSGIPIQSCGCFGKRDTPPTRIHVIVNAALAIGSLAAISSPPLVDGFASEPAATVGVVAFGGVGAYLLYLILAELPATLAAVRSRS